MDHWILSYKSPAEAWNEALPLGNGTPCRPAYDGLPPPAFRENRPARDKGRFLSRPAGILPRIVSGLLKYFVILDAKRTDSEHLNNHNFKAL